MESVLLFYGSAWTDYANFKLIHLLLIEGPFLQDFIGNLRPEVGWARAGTQNLLAPHSLGILFVFICPKYVLFLYPSL